MNKEIKEMTLDELNEAKEELRTALSADDADLDSIEKDINSIEARKAEITNKIEKRNQLLAAVAANGKVVESMNTQTANAEIRKDESSVEYRNAYLKTLADKMECNGFGSMNEEERSAFTFTTSNTGAVVPTITLNRIKELVASMAPMYDDATKTALAEGFRLVRHTGITQGDAATTTEGVANDDETDTFDYLDLTGVEIKKHADVTRKMRFNSIEAFEDWLVAHIAQRILVAKDKIIIARLDNTSYGIASGNKITGDYEDITIRKALAKVKANGAKTIYANNKTIYEGLAGIENTSGQKVFIPSAMVDPIVAGSLYGAKVKIDENIPDGVAYIGVSTEILANNFDDYAFKADEAAKSWVTTFSGYSLFDAGLENPYAFAKINFNSISA